VRGAVKFCYRPREGGPAHGPRRKIRTPPPALAEPPSISERSAQQTGAYVEEMATGPADRRTSDRIDVTSDLLRVTSRYSSTE
jgi:hypothetical protein